MKKRDAHHGLSLMAAQYGIPPHLIIDGSKEQTLREFRKKARQFGCHIKQSWPYSPWQIMAEEVIKELKRGSGRKIIKNLSPDKLWDHCIELEAFIQSHTALDIYYIRVEVPKTLLSGQTADIYTFVEHEWYNFVNWFDHGSAFPEPKELHGRWLGASIYIGPAMC